MVAGGGSDAKDSNPGVAQGGAKVTKPKPKPPKHGRHGEKPPPLQFTGVDPFEPLIAPAPVPTEPPAADPQASPSAPAGQPGATLVVQGTTLTLVDLPVQDGTQKAQVLVNGILYQLIPGDAFGNGFAITSISPPCADFTWGSEGFRLCLTA
jgi:hypothetical protein